MAWGFQNLFFVGANPKKMCQLWHGIFIFFCGSQPKKKQGASYGMSISKPYFFWGVPTQKIGASYGVEISKPYYYLVVFPKNGKSYGMEPALFLFEGLPKKSCYFWHGIFPKKCASYGMLLPLIYFHLVVTPKKMCQLWHGNLFPSIYLGVDPFIYLYLVFYPQQPQPKTDLPTHPFFSKKITAALAPAAGVKKKCHFWQVEPLQASVL